MGISRRPPGEARKDTEGVGRRDSHHNLNVSATCHPEREDLASQPWSPETKTTHLSFLRVGRAENVDRPGGLPGSQVYSGFPVVNGFQTPARDVYTDERREDPSETPEFRFRSS